MRPGGSIAAVRTGVDIWGTCPRKAGIMACGILWAENASSQEVHMENWRRHRASEKVDDQRGEVAINPGV